MKTYAGFYKAFTLIMMLFVCATSSCVSTVKESASETEVPAPKTDPFFSSFSEFNKSSANFRVGAETDTPISHIKIKAMTTAKFDDAIYTPYTIYILKHQSGDSIVVETGDVPLISCDEFKKFYENNKENVSADTIIDSNVFESFFLTNHEDVINVESFDHLPFLFLDVNFNGHPALLVRDNVGQEFYYYKVYGINNTGFHQVKYEPFLSIKSRTNTWCYGGSTEFDYKHKTITVHNLSRQSCSDYGMQITDVYKLNAATAKFNKTRITRNYEFD